MRANEVEIDFNNDEEQTYVILGRLIPDVGFEWYWCFSCSEAVNEKDNKEIYLERDDQGWHTYGGVEQFILSRNRIQFYLSEEASIALNCQ